MDVAPIETGVVVEEVVVAVERFDRLHCNNTTVVEIADVACTQLVVVVVVGSATDAAAGRVDWVWHKNWSWMYHTEHRRERPMRACWDGNLIVLVAGASYDDVAAAADDDDDDRRCSMGRWRKIVVLNGATTEMLCDDVISNPNAFGKTIVVVVVVVHDFDDEDEDDSEEYHHYYYSCYCVASFYSYRLLPRVPVHHRNSPAPP